jgi:hypothetical protein
MVLVMERRDSTEKMSFFDRLGLAIRLVFSGVLGGQIATALRASEVRPSAAAPKPAALPPERTHASGLLVLAALQREGRLIDFLQQEVNGFSDEEVGAAARVVHAGCHKVLKQYLELGPALPDAEGSTVTVVPGFDAQRIRLTGNVAGQPPFRGSLKHHGWVANEIRIPAPSESLDPRIVAPAEVELP